VVLGVRKMFYKSLHVLRRVAGVAKDEVIKV
jgi:hypothetical protein